jgi:hypothetical protein
MLWCLFHAQPSEEEKSYKEALCQYNWASMRSTAAPVFSGATIAACIMVVIESISRSHDVILGTSMAVLVPVGLLLPTFMAFMPREDKHSAYWMEVVLETATFLFSRFAIMFVFLGRIEEDQGSQQMIFTLYLLALSATLLIGLIHVHRKLVDFFFVNNTDEDTCCWSTVPPCVR